jgi:hypothetical protein
MSVLRGNGCSIPIQGWQHYIYDHQMVILKMIASADYGWNVGKFRKCNEKEQMQIQML